MPVILDYPYVENKVCAGEYIKTYPTLADAKAGCNKNDECGLITDITCNNENLKTCKGGSLVKNDAGSCSWIKYNEGKCLIFRLLKV